MTESEDRLIRLKDLLKIYPVSRATWYAGCKKGKYPASVKLGPRMVAWRYSDIRKLIEQGRGQ